MFLRTYEVRDEIAQLIKVPQIFPNEIDEKKDCFLKYETNNILTYSNRNDNDLNIDNYVIDLNSNNFTENCPNSISPSKKEKKTKLNIISQKFNTFSLFSGFYNLLNKMPNFLFGNSNVDMNINSKIISGNQSGSKSSNVISYTTIAINSMGNLAALVNDENEIIMINLALVPFESQKIITNIQNELINSFSFHPLYTSQFIFTTLSTVYIYKYKEKNVEINYEKIINSPSILINAVFSPNGKYLALLSHNSFQLLDGVTYEKIFSKKFFLKKFKNLIFSQNSMFFVLFTSNEIMIMNTFTLDFKTYSLNNNGEIVAVEISKNSNYILFFVKYKNELLIYTLYNVNEDDYSVKSYHSYNNTPLSYIQSKFKLFYNIYTISHVFSEDEVYVKMNISNNRLFISYLHDIVSERKFSIFEINFGENVHQFKIKEISNVAKFQGMEVKHFSVGYDIMRKKDFVMCNLDDKFINKFYVGI